MRPLVKKADHHGSVGEVPVEQGAEPVEAPVMRYGVGGVLPFFDSTNWDGGMVLGREGENMSADHGIVIRVRS
jgi:hypothetical protein